MAAPQATGEFRLALLNRLIDQCEAAPPFVQAEMLNAVALAISDKFWVVEAFAKAGAFMDAALAMLPEGSCWRRYTDSGCAVYAASPFNAAAQVRYDGRGQTAALGLCAALLRMRLAKEAKALGISPSPAAVRSAPSVNSLSGPANSAPDLSGDHAQGIAK